MQMLQLKSSQKIEARCWLSGAWPIGGLHKIFQQGSFSHPIRSHNYIALCSINLKLWLYRKRNISFAFANQFRLDMPARDRYGTAYPWPRRGNNFCAPHILSCIKILQAPCQRIARHWLCTMYIKLLAMFKCAPASQISAASNLAAFGSFFFFSSSSLFEPHIIVFIFPNRKQS